jgi:hypothetical protein
MKPFRDGLLRARTHACTHTHTPSRRRTRFTSLNVLRPSGDIRVRNSDGEEGKESLATLECLSSLHALGLHLLLEDYDDL